MRAAVLILILAGCATAPASRDLPSRAAVGEAIRQALACDSSEDASCAEQPRRIIVHSLRCRPDANFEHPRRVLCRFSGRQVYRPPLPGVRARMRLAGPRARGCLADRHLAGRGRLRHLGCATSATSSSSPAPASPPNRASPPSAGRTGCGRATGSRTSPRRRRSRAIRCWSTLLRRAARQSGDASRPMRRTRRWRGSTPNGRASC